VIKLSTSGLSKKYFKELIFKNISMEFQQGHSYAVTGPNGSGKSTLLKVLAGIVPPSAGSLDYIINEKEVDQDHYYRYLTFISPYLELIEEFTLKEFLNFHFKLKKFKSGFDLEGLLSYAYLEDSINKEIRNFSSGMKQRLKLSLAFCGDTPMVFLDEPTTNLDENAINWYKEGVKKHLSDRLLFIASNQLKEYESCETFIDIMDFKQNP
jgi:ABC-type multidrug transport system ATPase subunit